MNSLVRDHLPATYFAQYQERRTELMALLTDDDLTFRPGPAALTLGELCREIGEIEHSYIQAFRTFWQDLDWHNDDPRMEQSVAAITAWYEDLDRNLMTALEALTEDDIAGRRITRSDSDDLEFWPLAAQELDIYREALLIFYAKASIYLRILDKGLPGHWPAWIG